MYAIGGDGMTVEIDENILFKRKYHTGRYWQMRLVVNGFLDEYVRKLGKLC
jgi:hypothetical protein